MNVPTIIVSLLLAASIWFAVRHIRKRRGSCSGCSGCRGCSGCSGCDQCQHQPKRK